MCWRQQQAPNDHQLCLSSGCTKLSMSTADADMFHHQTAAWSSRLSDKTAHVMLFCMHAWQLLQ